MFAKYLETLMKKNVGVVCVTYRDAKNPSLVREFGLVALVEQMFSQEYDGKITLSIVDSSENPHSYLQKMSEQHPDKLIYNHIPERNNAPKQACQNSFIPNDDIIRKAIYLNILRLHAQNRQIPTAMYQITQCHPLSSASPKFFDILIGRENTTSFLSSDTITQIQSEQTIEALENDSDVIFWASRLNEMQDMSGFIPFEADYPIQTNIFSQIFASRPTIGMKKNYGIQALVDAGFKSDVIAFSDDDDHHSPNYIAKSVQALGQNDFTRMTRYLTHMFNAPADIKEWEWGAFNLPVHKDSNGYWRLDAQHAEMPLYRRHPEGHMYEQTLGGKFSRLVTMAWPILSHEGALHTYSFDIWNKSINAIGGCAPVSFCEDMIFYRRLKDHFGAEFKDVLTPIENGEEEFIRLSDGMNASVAEVTEKLPFDKIPEWARESITKLYNSRLIP